MGAQADNVKKETSMLAMEKYNLSPKMFHAMGTYKTSPNRILYGNTNTMLALSRRGFAENVNPPGNLWRLTDEGVRAFEEIEAERAERYAARIRRDRMMRGMK